MPRLLDGAYAHSCVAGVPITMTDDAYVTPSQHIRHRNVTVLSTDPPSLEVSLKRQHVQLSVAVAVTILRRPDPFPELSSRVN